MENFQEENNFMSKSVLTRMAIILAGVTMNFLLAIVVLSFGFWYGLPQVLDSNLAHGEARDVKVSILQVFLPILFFLGIEKGTAYKYCLLLCPKAVDR